MRFRFNSKLKLINAFSLANYLVVMCRAGQTYFHRLINFCNICNTVNIF